MYEPLFNTVVVQIDDKENEWGHGNDESMLGKAFRAGTIITVGPCVGTHEHPLDDPDFLTEKISKLKGKKIMWNEGVEAGTVFEFDGKQFGMIYWWDIRGVLVGKDV